MKLLIAMTALLAAAAASLAVPPPPPVLKPPSPPALTPTAKEPDPIRIAMVQTLFTDVPTPLVNMLSPPFRGMMKEYTGLNGQPFAGGDAFDIAKELMEDKVHIGVLHGVEYAWVAQKYPDIKPLMLAVSKYHNLKAHLVVRGDCDCAEFADLKGKDLAVPFRSREHLRLYVEKCCRTTGQCDPKTYFSKLTKPLHAEAALDDVLSGKSCAAIVDTLAWENYADVKPGCFKRLKSIKESEPFPTAVVVYRQGMLSDATLEKFRQGMMSANKTERGRDLMTLWKLTGFEPVSPEYLQNCAAIVQSYPPPVTATTVSRPGR